MHSDERCRARRIDRHRWAVYAKEIGEATSCDAVGISKRRVSVDSFFVGVNHAPVIAIPDSNKDARGAVAQRRWRDRGIFQCFPGSLEQKPMLGIYADGLAGRH